VMVVPSTTAATTVAHVRVPPPGFAIRNEAFKLQS
jgi:hypothetical protein